MKNFITPLWKYNLRIAINRDGEIQYSYKTDEPLLGLFKTNQNLLGLISTSGVSLLKQQSELVKTDNYPIKISAFNSSFLTIVTDDEKLMLFHIKGTEKNE